MAESTKSELVQELSARVLAQDDKVPTTIRIPRRTLKRLRAQEKRWATTMSFIVERALDPVLTELENAKLPVDGDGDGE
jgi:predicted DNA-binding protein